MSLLLPVPDYNQRIMCPKERFNRFETQESRVIKGPPVNPEPTFYGLLKGNRQFRLFLLSYVITLCGEWLTYVALITMIEAWLHDEQKSSRTAISYFVLIRLFPNVIFSAAGGALADSRDRRQSIIALDILAALVTLLFLLVWYSKSIATLYLVTMLQQIIAALYEPCHSALMPLLITNEEELKKATTLSGLAWSLVAAVGASLGGVIVSSYGCRVCFILDSLTYLMSALIMYEVRGNWHVVDENAVEYSSLWNQMVGMTIEGYRYIASKFWGSLVLLNASIALVYGASDVLNVSFSERGHADDASLKLGILFGMVGVGCLLGPLVSDRFTSMSNLKSLQLSSIYSIGFTTLGCLGVGLFSPFPCTCIFTMVRSAGSSAAWINSSVLLQSFSAPEKLGRVMAVNYALALLMEGFSAFMGGVLQDHAGMSAEQVSLVMACVGTVALASWSCYHVLGYGAAHMNVDELIQFELIPDQKEATSESTPLLLVGHAMSV
jgi:MFS family permease